MAQLSNYDILNRIQQKLVSLTGWKGDRVLYFGDHIFHDLKEPSSSVGWKTGVIIKGIKWFCLFRFYVISFQ